MFTDNQIGTGVLIVLAMFTPALVVAINARFDLTGPMKKLTHKLLTKLRREVIIHPDSIHWDGSREYGTKFALWPDPMRPKALLVWDMLNHDMSYVTYPNPADIQAEYTSRFCSYLDWMEETYGT